MCSLREPKDRANCERMDETHLTCPKKSTLVAQKCMAELSLDWYKPEVAICFYKKRS